MQTEPLLFVSEGMAHRLAVWQSGDENAIVIVDRIQGAGLGQTATLTGDERKALAKALDPDAYEELGELRGKVIELDQEVQYWANR